MTTILNQLPELIAFVQSVQTGSFSAAARSLNTTPSAVSKRVAKLEDRLNVRLLQRTTRSLNLTTEGTAYYERVSRLLTELEDANDLIMTRGKPRGKLTISAPLDFGRLVLAHWMPDFLAQYPEVQIDLRLSDRFVDLVEEGIDVAIRMGTLEDSSLIRKHLGEVSYVVCASPTYLKAHGTPKAPEQLVNHNCLRFVSNGHPLPWMFVMNGESQDIAVTGTLDSDNGDVLRLAALSHVGIIRVLEFQVESELQNKRLRKLFDDELLPSRVIQAVYTHKRNLSPRVQAFLEFLVTQFTR
ncbi:MAG: LysR family transcriptional regulator [Oculatellaceae cyanobacterium bins.114]|nr:LysR family transcriptional regulator [Oculatellaceae cyanobacterium bins.114]